jgi:hypothetical protein
LSKVIGGSGAGSWASPSPGGDLEKTGPTSVFIEGGDVFWTTGGLSLAMKPGSVLSCPLAGPCTAPKLLSHTIGNPTNVAVKGADVFVLSQTGLYKMKRDGSDTTRLTDGASGKGGWVALVTDGAKLYWGDGGSVLQCDVAACAPTTLAQVSGQGVKAWRSTTTMSTSARRASRTATARFVG